MTSHPDPVPPLTQETLRRLVKVLGMLGSDHDGERAAAALQASRLLRDRGLTWEEVLARPRATPNPYGPADLSDTAPVWRQVAARCRGAAARLSVWEVAFLDSIAGAARLSEAADQVLCLIADKVLGAVR